MDQHIHLINTQHITKGEEDAQPLLGKAMLRQWYGKGTTGRMPRLYLLMCTQQTWQVKLPVLPSFSSSLYPGTRCIIIQTVAKSLRCNWQKYCVAMQLALCQSWRFPASGYISTVSLIITNAAAAASSTSTTILLLLLSIVL